MLSETVKKLSVGCKHHRLPHAPYTSVPLHWACWVPQVLGPLEQQIPHRVCDCTQELRTALVDAFSSSVEQQSSQVTESPFVLGAFVQGMSFYIFSSLTCTGVSWVISSCGHWDRPFSPGQYLGCRVSGMDSCEDAKASGESSSGCR